MSSHIYLYHYTKRTSATGIEQAGNIRPSTGAKHSRYGQGVYLTSLHPARRTTKQVANIIYANPGGLIPPGKTDVAFEFLMPRREVDLVNEERDVWLYDSGHLNLRPFSTGVVYVSNRAGAYVRAARDTWKMVGNPLKRRSRKEGVLSRYKPYNSQTSSCRDVREKQRGRTTIHIDYMDFLTALESTFSDIFLTLRNAWEVPPSFLLRKINKTTVWKELKNDDDDGRRLKC